MVGLRKLIEAREVRRPDPHDHTQHSGLGRLRQVEFRASQGRGEGRGIGQERRHLRLQEARLRGDGHIGLTTDQLGTQLDPPAHWAPEFPSIDELPATYAVRPLVVISIVEQVKKDPN